MTFQRIWEGVRESSRGKVKRKAKRTHSSHNLDFLSLPALPDSCPRMASKRTYLVRSSLAFPHPHFACKFARPRMTSYGKACNEERLAKDSESIGSDHHINSRINRRDAGRGGRGCVRVCVNFYIIITPLTTFFAVVPYCPALSERPLPLHSPCLTLRTLFHAFPHGSA